MNIVHSSAARTARVLAIGLLFLLPTVLWAQEEGPGYINVRIQTVKPDGIAQWESLRKEYSEAAEAAGQPFYHVFQRQRGPLSTFLLISPGSAVGEPGMAIEEPPAVSVSTNWLNALFSTLDNQSLVTLQNYPDASTNESGSAHPGGNYLFARIRTVAAGRNQDYEAWLTDELIPALGAAGENDVRTLRSVLGGNPRTWVTFTFVDGWPNESLDLDQRMLARGDSMVVSQTNYLYSFREDLSFTAAN